MLVGTYFNEIWANQNEGTVTLQMFLAQCSLEHNTVLEIFVESNTNKCWVEWSYSLFKKNKWSPHLPGVRDRITACQAGVPLVDYLLTGDVIGLA
jgi:hypothetical protein